MTLEQALRDRVLLLNAVPCDTAWDPRDFDEGFPLKRPDQVLDWSRKLLDAGADILETHTFGADRIMCDNPSAISRLGEWNRVSVRIAREAARKEKFVVGATGLKVPIMGDIFRRPVHQHLAAAREQIRELWQAGVDAIHLDFCEDMRDLKSTLTAIAELEQEFACRIPTMITFDFEEPYSGLYGQSLDEIWPAIKDYRPLAVGVSSFRGHDHESLRRLRDVSDVPLGMLLDPAPSLLVTEGVKIRRPPSWLADTLEPLLAEGLLNYCGLSWTVPSFDYVRTVAALIRRS